MSMRPFKSKIGDPTTWAALIEMECVSRNVRSTDKSASRLKVHVGIDEQES